jgi:hypothetical protein
MRLLRYIWAFPATLLGLALVPFAYYGGGEVQLVDGVLEVHGGIVTWIHRKGLPWTGPGAAMALGHVIIGCDALCLQKCRIHERVHVRQYERWGPFFIPLYLLASLHAYFRGRDPYRDNPFEREAFDSE